MERMKQISATLQQHLIEVSRALRTGFKPVIILEERGFEKLVVSLESIKES